MTTHRDVALMKASEYTGREGVIGVAITGSVARDWLWAGSDVDLYVVREGETGFEDGVCEGIYWEVDLKPSSYLDVDLSDRRWTEPLPLFEGEETIVESLWGCEIVYDPQGKLEKVRAAIDKCMGDPAWLNRRAANYVQYGLGCVDALRFAEPLTAIVGARCVATDYGVTAFWMKRGGLLTSVSRIPEMLPAGSAIHALYRDIFSLNGEAEARQILDSIGLLRPTIQLEIQRDIELEMLPLLGHGVYDGLVRYLRQGVPSWFSPEDAKPVLGLEPDLGAQAARVLDQTRELLTAVAFLDFDAGEFKPFT